MDEVKSLLNESLEKLKTAEILFENERYDDAISRAYYAMFYSAKALLTEKNIYPKTHKGVKNQFGLEFVKNSNFNPAIFKFFVQLQQDRQDADYEILIKFTKNQAKNALANAEIFINECKNFE